MKKESLVFLAIVILFLITMGFLNTISAQNLAKINYLHSNRYVNNIIISENNVFAAGYLGVTVINKGNHNDRKTFVDVFKAWPDGDFFNLFLKKDSKGKIFAHNDHALFRYHEGDFILIQDFKNILDFFIDQNDRIYVLYDFNHIAVLDANGHIIHYNPENSSLPDFSFQKIAVNKNVMYLSSMYNGLTIFDGETCQIMNSGNSNLPHDIITAISIDDQDNIWLACHTQGHHPHYNQDHTLVKISGNHWTIYNSNNSAMTSRRINNIIPFGNRILLCSQGNGLIEFDGTSWESYNILNSNILSDNVLDVTIDSQSMWVATDMGISLLSSEPVVNLDLNPTTLTGIFQGPVAEDLSGNIWIGTAGTFGSLSKYNGEKWEKYISGTSSNPQSLHSIAIDLDNTVWATSYSTHGGLYRIQNGSVVKFDQYNSTVPEFPMDVVVDKFNNKWIISDWSLVKYNNTAWTVYNNNDFEYLNLLRTIVADQDGNIWIGIGQNGMVKFDGENWTHFDEDFFGEEYPQVNRIKVDSNNNIWIDYSNANWWDAPKLAMYDGHSLQWYDENISLPERSNGLLHIDSIGNLWYSSTRGLAYYDWNKWHFINAENSPLLSNHCGNFHKDSKGYIWLQSDGYLAAFEQNTLNIRHRALPETPKPNKKFLVFPNPCNNIIFVKPQFNFSPNSALSVMINSLDGRLLRSYEIYTHNFMDFDISGLGKGIFIIQFIGSEFTEGHLIQKLTD